MTTFPVVQGSAPRHLRTDDALTDEEGKLLTDLGPGGQTWKLQANPSAGTSETILTSAMGRVSRTAVTQNGAGNEIRKQTSADGTSVTTVQTPSSATTTLPDGTLLTQTTDPDPRWGMSAPFARQRTTIYPSGLKVEVRTTREAELGSPGDPHSVISLTSTTSVGAGLPWTETYEAASRTLTLKSASGRVARRQIDDHGRVLRVEAPGVLPVSRTYDAEGRPLTVEQGARLVSYTYTDGGYLGTVKDALGRTATLSRDAAGRPLSLLLPGPRSVVFAASSPPPPRLARRGGRGRENADRVFPVKPRHRDEFVKNLSFLASARGPVPLTHRVNQLHPCCLAHRPLPLLLSPHLAAGSKVGEATAPAR